MSDLISLLPRPFYELGLGCYQCRSYSDLLKDTDQKRTLVRLIVSMTQYYLFHRQYIPLSVGVSTSFFLSYPALSMAVGIHCVYEATQIAFESLTSAFLLLAAGWFFLEKHEISTWGLLERCLPQRSTVPSQDSVRKPPSDVWLDKDKYSGFISQDELISRLSSEWNSKGEFLDFEKSEDPSRGIFQAKSIVDKLGTQEVIEFFYCHKDMSSSKRAHKRGSTITGKGKQQVYYASFANTFDRAFICDGLKWKSREHYYQAQKFKEGSKTYDEIQQAEGILENSSQLRKEIKKSQYRGDLRIKSPDEWQQWDSRDCMLVMIHANHAYFAQHQDDRELLLSTDDLPIVERNAVADVWGISFETNEPVWINGSREETNCNRQGWILMYLRDFFRKSI